MVSVADEYVDDLPAVVAGLRRAGLVVDEVLEVIGAVTGSIDADATADLESVPGVASVERQRSYKLPPPDSDLQ